jgi:uncharacterized protein
VKRFLLPLLILLAASCGEGEAARSANESRPATPQSVVSPMRTLPALTGRVVDEADILSAPTESALISRLAALEAKTSDQLVVVTVPDLGGESIETFGLRLGNGWGVGREDVDNGVLVIVAPNNRNVRIEVGVGLEGLLTDARAAQIIEGLLPRLRAGDYDGGVAACVGEIVRTLESDTKRPIPRTVPRVA